MKKNIRFCAALILAMLVIQPLYNNKETTPVQTTPVVTKSNCGVTHLGIIMDGNRRWAKKRKLSPWQGHQEGTGPVKQAVKFCLEHDIPYLSLYAFSLENFKRSSEELGHLFKIIETGLCNDEFQKLVNHGVRIRFVGDRTLFPESLVPVITDLEEQTRQGTKLNLAILFCYGGKQDLVHGIQEIAKKVYNNTLHPDAITEQTVQDNLWSHSCPNLDLIIRTGGKKRLSNFLPWQAAYSELLFVDTYWPEMTADDLAQALTAFAATQRNFGS